MAQKDLGDVVDELQSIGRTMGDINQAVGTLLSIVGTALTIDKSGQSGLQQLLPGGVGGGGRGTTGTAQGSESTSTAQKQADKSRQQFRSAVSKVGTGFVRSASDPLTPTALAGLSAGENLLAVIAGSVAGDKGAEAAQALVGAGFNQLGGREARYTLENSVRDLQGTLSTMADLGLDPTDEQLDQFTKTFQARAKRRFDLLKRGAESVDRVTGGQLTGLEQSNELRNQYLRTIAENTKRPGGNAPDADLRPD